MEQRSAEALKAATSYTKTRDDGTVFLEGSRCRLCGARFVGEREHCARCGTRDSMESHALSEHGHLYNYTVVHRSYPGVPVPFISAVVDLDDGTSLKGNLLDIDPDSAALKFGLPVKVVFRGAETASAEGQGYVAHFFVPA